MRRIAILLCWVVLGPALAAQRTPQLVQIEIRQAEKEVPQLADVLQLKSGMIVADVGSGGGAMSLVLSRYVGESGRVYTTDIRPEMLAEIRELVARERLANVTVLEGGARSTNLPDACCDAIFLRDVYHHLTSPAEINRSLLASLKPGGRLAIIDFEPEPGSKVPDGVPANRGGHGVPTTVVVDEVRAEGLTFVRTVSNWPPNDERARLFLALFRKP